VKPFRKDRKMFRIVLIVLLSIAVLSTVAFCIFRHYELEPIRRGEFTPELWDKYPQYRHKMIVDMEMEIDIWNLSRKEIISVLGTNAANIPESGTISYKINDGFVFSGYYTIWFSEDDDNVTDIFIDHDF